MERVSRRRGSGHSNCTSARNRKQINLGKPVTGVNPVTSIRSLRAGRVFAGSTSKLTNARAFAPLTLGGENSVLQLPLSHICLASFPKEARNGHRAQDSTQRTEGIVPQRRRDFMSKAKRAGYS